MDDLTDDVTIQLLRLAGERSSAPAPRAARVRAAVHAEWKTAARRRAARRRGLIVSASLAAAVALVIGSSFVGRELAVTPGEAVASVEKIDGPVAVNETVRTGEWIETGPEARIALRFRDGTSVRLDAGSRARPLSSGSVELSAGAVYVDTGRESGRFEVRTPLATARDLGTQFEVRVLDRSVRLRVRTGVVELADRARSVTGREGTEITWSEAGAVSRPFAPHGPAWDWATQLSPPLTLDGVTLADFLGQLAREQGWTLTYVDDALAREAGAIVLHGSVAGLSADDALDVAMRTSGLGHRLEEGELIVLPEGQTANPSTRRGSRGAGP
jgi:ferric-dicitrate binding protein FerR (iron transport regulator)